MAVFLFLHEQLSGQKDVKRLKKGKDDLLFAPLAPCISIVPRHNEKELNILFLSASSKGTIGGQQISSFVSAALSTKDFRISEG